MKPTIKVHDSENVVRPRPVVLLLIDGWGVAPGGEVNAVSTADIPNFLGLIEEYPVAILDPGAKSLNERYVDIGQGLSQVLADNNLSQIKIAETERFAALTYFFNGQQEGTFNGEEQKIISSALDRPMKEVVKETSQAIKSGNYDFIVSVIADLDNGIEKGTTNIKGIIEEIDDNLKKLSAEVINQKGVLIISAATGNAERIKNIGTDIVDKKMTNNPVPLIIVGEDFKDKNIGLTDPLSSDLSMLALGGSLSNLAPTILKIMKLKLPPGMRGVSLIDY